MTSRKPTATVEKQDEGAGPASAAAPDALLSHASLSQSEITILAVLQDMAMHIAEDHTDE